MYDLTKPTKFCLILEISIFRPASNFRCCVGLVDIGNVYTFQGNHQPVSLLSCLCKLSCERVYDLKAAEVPVI